MRINLSQDGIERFFCFCRIISLLGQFLEKTDRSREDLCCGLDVESKVAFREGQKQKEKMRTIQLAITAGALALALQASATLLPIIAFDENGNATFNANGSGVASGPVYTSQQVYDSHSANAFGSGPVPAGNATTLDYLYQYAGVTHLYGWVAIYDDAAHTQLSDLIHFDNSLSVNGVIDISMFFYSLDADGDKADQNYPGNSTPTQATINSILSNPNTVTITEDAAGIAYYTPPTTNSPGYFVNGSTGSGAGLQQYEYEFISSVPEPTTMIAGALLLLPFGASTLRILRKTRKA